MPKVLLVYGTRPEAVKMAPLVRALAEDDVLVPVVALTGQHREMVAQVHGTLGVRADVELDVFAAGQSLTALTAKVLQGAARVIEDVAPQAVVVQGDTTSAFAAGLAAFYAGVPVVHLEAGLRTGDKRNPFPEEMNRGLLGRLADLHLAPTDSSRRNLLHEGIPAESVAVTGNTVIDALHLTVSATHRPLADPRLAAVLAGRPADPARSRVVTVTTHRRESWGQPLDRVFTAVDVLARQFPDHDFVVPLHPNPTVRRSAAQRLGAHDNVTVLEPLEYADFCHLMAVSRLLLTDSGGVQEEAPSLGVPVLVLRETTERPEAVDAGTVALVGTGIERIVDEAGRLLADPVSWRGMARAVNPYGDGRAAARSVAAVRELLGLGRRLPDFTPGAGAVLVDGATAG